MSKCKHEHQIQMVNYDINNNMKSWIQCVDCDKEIKE